MVVLPNGARAALEISAGGSSHVSCAGNICRATTRNAVLSVRQLQKMLATGNVSVASGPDAGDIAIDTALTWVGPTKLTLDAHGSIAVNAAVSVAGSGGLALNYGDGDQVRANLSFSSTGRVGFWSVSDRLAINGDSYMLIDSVKTLANGVAARPDGKFALAASYDAGADGTYEGSPVPEEFRGRFEGLGNAISNLSIDALRSDHAGAGLFALIGSTGRLRNVVLINAKLTDVHAAFQDGLLAATNGGSIAGCSVDGALQGTGSYLGGLVGHNMGTIARSNATVTLATNVGGFDGGLVGLNDISATVRDSEASGTITDNDLQDSASVGGLVGYNFGFIDGSKASAAIVSAANSYLGGLVGQNGNWIVNSSASGAISGGRRIAAGGLVGWDFGGAIQSSFASGNVAGGDITTAGGFIGLLSGGTIADGYAEGSIASGDSSVVGGFVGFSELNSGSSVSLATSSSYSTGSVGAKRGSLIGGFAGEDDGANDITGSYWDKTSSGRRMAVGNRGSEPGIIGRTTAQLQSGVPAGFDSETWSESPKINGGLPYLRANPPP